MKPVVGQAEGADAGHVARSGLEADEYLTAEKGSPPLAHATKYRPDIDGLRAISVVAVILFHLSPRHAQGGGIGVDVFFVISGYLIGGIILSSLDQGKFSFRQFYLRRLRRIFPAFAVMALTTFVFSLWFLYPDDLKKYSLSALWALACSSNIFFFNNTDYFSNNSNAPLLHTWTLGVEEQFYFFFPILAVGCVYLLGKRRIAPMLAILFVVSLVISQLQVPLHSAAAFYLLPSRAWELMVGVIAARLPAKFVRGGQWQLSAAIVGLVLVVGSLIFLDPARNFPGLKAIPPCVGAALLIVSGERKLTFVHQLLALPPMRLVGLASYSLYLWHWPVIIFLMNYYVGKLTIGGMVQAVLISAALGFLSWRFVETPWRSPAVPTRRLLTSCAVLAATILACFSSVAIFNGYPGRIPAKALALDAAQSAAAAYTMPKAHCFLVGYEKLKDYNAAACLKKATDRPNWLLVGDSHAAMLYGGLIKAYPGVNFLTAVSYGCDVRIDAQADGTPCNDLMHSIFSQYLPTSNLTGVILVSRWTIVDPARLTALSASIHARGQQFVVIGPSPEYSVPVAHILAEAERRGDPALATRTLLPGLWGIDQRLRNIAASAHFAYLSPMTAMCPDHVDCVLSDGKGIPLYFDHTHYTDVGALSLLAHLASIDPTQGYALGNSLGVPKAAH
jgi:peptidoglycan/LPS O-acetylase OafA/YrhL